MVLKQTHKILLHLIFQMKTIPFEINQEELDNKSLNEVIGLSKKILKILYIVLIVGAILAIVTIFKVSGLFKLLMGVLKVISPLFIGFVIAWLFNPLVKIQTKKFTYNFKTKTILFFIGLFLILLSFTLFEF